MTTNFQPDGYTICVPSNDGSIFVFDCSVDQYKEFLSIRKKHGKDGESAYKEILAKKCFSSVYTTKRSFGEIAKGLVQNFDLEIQIKKMKDELGGKEL